MRDSFRMVANPSHGEFQLPRKNLEYLSGLGSLEFDDPMLQ